MRVLHLTLHRVWFAAIASSEKREEYSAITARWRARLEGRAYDEVHFRNGYRTDAAFMRVRWRGVRMGEWQGAKVYAIQLGEILEVRGWPITSRSSCSPSTSGG